MKKILCFVKYHTDLDDLLRRIYLENKDVDEVIENVKRPEDKERSLVTNLGTYKVTCHSGADYSRVCGDRCNKIYLDPRYTVEEICSVFIPYITNMEEGKYKDDYIELLYDYI